MIRCGCGATDSPGGKRAARWRIGFGGTKEWWGEQDSNLRRLSQQIYSLNQSEIRKHLRVMEIGLICIAAQQVTIFTRCHWRVVLITHCNYFLVKIW